MHTGFTFTVHEPDQRLDLFLVQQTGHSRAFIQSQIDSGRVTRNGTTCTKASTKLKALDLIAGRFEEAETTSIVAVHAPLTIVFEDTSFLVIDKPQGLVVHPAAGHRGDTLVHYLLHYLQNDPGFGELGQARPGIVHRLDRGTSGLILVAKNRATQEALSSMFKNREIKKEYEAIAWGRTAAAAGVIKSVIGRDKRDRKKMSSHTANGREAVTEWARIRAFQHFSHLRLKPYTGRTHQLRVHLWENKNPIAGDPLYGGGTKTKSRSTAGEVQAFLAQVEHPFLHAAKLNFRHPDTGEMLEFAAPRPLRFEEFLSILGKFDPERKDAT